MSKTCPACGTGNRPLARFCRKCASPLPAAEPSAADRVRAGPDPAAGERHTPCASCGKPNRSVALFCRSCGVAMAAPAAAAPPRAPAPRAVRPARPSVATAPRRPLWLVLILAMLLGSAMLWWQRGSAPTPTEPVEEILSTPAMPQDATATPVTAPTAPLPPTPTPAAEPAPAMAAATASAAAAAAPVASAPQASAPAPEAAGAAEPTPPPKPAAARPAPRLAPAPRAPASSVAAGPLSPDDACADRNAFTRAVCVSVQCVKSAYRRHPTCVRLENEARERRRYEAELGAGGE
jgi:hypothetical protein